MKLKNISLREYEETDIPFIFKSWLVNFRASNYLEDIIDHDIYFEFHKRLVEKILSDSICLLAANPEDESQVFGYIAYRKIKGLNILHYIYVKAPYRRLGIAEFLLDFVFEKKRQTIVTTHYTRMARVLRRKWNIVFNPYLLFDLY